MPPRKAAQAASKVPPQPVIFPSDRNENVSEEEVEKSLARWTDEQEITLLKGIVRWKPDGTGMHKHFRMIAIHNYMMGQGVIGSEDEHTSIPGIWTKLRSLYNLPILDEWEDSILHSSSDENGSPGELYCPFDLPENEYGALKFEKRINLDGSKSPALLNSRRESTITNTDEPGSSPAPVRRGGRATRRGGRVSKLQREAGTSQRTSKAVSATEDEPMEDAGDEEEEEEGSNEDDEDEEVEPSPKPKGSARGRGTSRTKGSRGRGGMRARGRKR